MIYKLLVRDGLLVIELPSFGYWLARNYGPASLLIIGRWCNFDAHSDKLFYLSDRALRSLVARAGFLVEERMPIRGVTCGGRVLQGVKSVQYGVARGLCWVLGRGASFAAKAAYVCRKQR